MSNDKQPIEATIRKWNDYPDAPKEIWKESEFCQFSELTECGDAIFQVKNTSYPTGSDLRDCFLSAKGHLERIEVVPSLLDLEIRISNIKKQNGVPDESQKALKLMLNREKNSQIHPVITAEM